MIFKNKAYELLVRLLSRNHFENTNAIDEINTKKSAQDETIYALKAMNAFIIIKIEKESIRKAYKRMKPYLYRLG